MYRSLSLDETGGTVPVVPRGHQEKITHLGFPLRERGGDGESSSSEVILFRTPIIEVEPQNGPSAPSSSSVLPAISELQVSGSYSPKETSTPKFGVQY